MALATLLGLRAVRFETPDGRQVGPVDWEIQKGDRIALDCQFPDAYLALVDIVSGQNEPLEGYLEEFERVVIQTDSRLKEIISPNQTVHEALHSTALPESLWLKQKRRSLWVAVDRLGLTPRHFHLPLKLEPPEIAEKLLALRFIASRAHLLIGREIFMSGLPEVRGLMAQRWNDFPGAVVCAAPENFLPGPANVSAVLDAAGTFRYERLAD